jgi:hypothetical protein
MVLAADAGDAHEPSKTSLRPVAGNDGVAVLCRSGDVTAVWSNSAGVIWQATKRFQINWYSFHSSVPELGLGGLAGGRDASVGRMPRGPPWALLLLDA